MQEMNLGGGTGAAYQFAAAGSSVTGRIVEFKQVQQTEFADGPTGSGIKKGDPKTFADGNPKMQIVVDLQTEYRNSEGLKEAVPAGTDDGKRTVYLYARKSPDTTSPLAAVVAATTAVCGKGAIHIGGELTLTMTGESKSASGPLAKHYSARYAAPSVDLSPTPAAVPAAPLPTPPASPAVAVPAPPAPPAAPSPVVTDPALANLTPAQLAVLGQPAVPPPPVAVPAPPVAPPAPAVKTTPEGFTLQMLLDAQWTREAALTAYPMLTP